MSTEQKPWNLAVSEVLARSATDSRFRSDVARGIRAQTEQYAFPHLHRHLGLMAAAQRTGAYRALGIYASERDLRHVPGRRVGRTLALLTHETSNEWPGAKVTGIGSRIMLLPDLDMEAAAEVLGAMLSHAASKGIGVDLYDLTSTLAFWEQRNGDKAREHRARIISDYYTPTISTK